MPGRASRTAQDFGAAFTALLKAAGLSVDALLEALPEPSVSRSTLYDWCKGEHLPADREPLLMVVRLCLRRVGERHADLGQVPRDERGWASLLAEAKQTRDSHTDQRGGVPRTRSRPAEPVSEPRRCQVGAVPRAADCFQERQVSAQLAQVVRGGTTVVLSQVLVGMGGVGKTQLAAAYVRNAWEQQDVDVLVWVTATSPIQIIAGYAAASAQLGLQDNVDGPGEAAARFLDWACTARERWLVVLDDIQDPGHLRGLWPASAPNGRVIATTRRRDAALTEATRRRVDVGLFSTAEARSFLNAKLADHGRTDDPDQMDALAADLGLLPLALAQAAVYLIDVGLDCQTYRERWADRRRTLTDLVPEEGSLPDEQRLIVASTWSLSIEQADHARPPGLARPLLQLASLLDPNGIPDSVLTSKPSLDYLTSHRRAITPTQDFRITADDAHDGLRVLHRYNLIDHNPQAQWREVRVHQLIQRATRETLTPAELASAVDAAADGILHLWPPFERNQLGAVLRASTAALQEAAPTALCTANGHAHPVLFRALTSLGQSGQVAAAISEYNTLHTIAAELLGPNHPDTLAIRSNLAYWRGESGDHTGAAAAFEQLLDDYVRVLGPDHPDTLSTCHSRAWWLGETRNPAGAVTAFEALLTDRTRVLGPDHPHTLTTRHALARWRGQAGDPIGAATACEDLLPDYVRVLGAHHPHTMATRHDLAWWLGEAGDPARAVAEYESLFTDRLQALGAGHPHTLATRHDLHWFKALAGDRAGAVAAFEELLADYEQLLGPYHPHTAATRDDLAWLREDHQTPFTTTSGSVGLARDSEGRVPGDLPGLDFLLPGVLQGGPAEWEGGQEMSAQGDHQSGQPPRS